MASTQVELNTVLQTLVLPNYENANVNNYYEPADNSIKAPTTDPDRGMQLITETILLVRNPAAFGYQVALDATTKKALYRDITVNLAAAIEDITDVYDAINAAYIALP